MTERPGSALEISVSFPPEKQFVQGVSDLLTQFCSRYLSDADAISRARMVTHELAENVVKYSSFPPVSMSACFLREGAQWVLRISARNRSADPHLSALRKLLEELTSSKDPVAFYDAIISQSAKRSHGSGLGLARVSAEGEMSISYEISGEQVLIVASCRVPLGSDELERALAGGLEEAGGSS
jgi:hypothetical protein